MNLKAVLTVPPLVLVVALAGCSTGRGGDASSWSRHSPVAAEKFADPYGGDGNAWIFPASCPDASIVTGILGTDSLTTPDEEADHSPYKNACHYANLHASLGGAGVEIFRDVKSYAGVTPADKNVKISAAPSLGRGARLASGGTYGACSAEVPSVPEGRFRSIVVTAIWLRKTPE